MCLVRVLFRANRLELGAGWLSQRGNSKWEPLPAPLWRRRSLKPKGKYSQRAWPSSDPEISWCANSKQHTDTHFSHTQTQFLRAYAWQDSWASLNHAPGSFPQVHSLGITWVISCCVSLPNNHFANGSQKDPTGQPACVPYISKCQLGRSSTAKRLTGLWLRGGNCHFPTGSRYPPNKHETRQMVPAK